MSSAYEKVLADLKKSSESVEQVKGTFPPTVKLHSKGGATKGAFLSGVLKSRKLVQINKKDQPVYSLVLAETNAKILKKEDKEWVETTAKVGDTVSFFAPTRLDRILRDVGSDIKVVIHYDGMEPVKTPHGLKDTHMFTVHVGKSSGGDSTAVVDTKTEPAKEAVAASSQADPFA